MQTKHTYRWKWVKLPGHARNEALDCRNYAMAGMKIINPDMMKMEQKIRDMGKKKQEKQSAPRQRQKKTAIDYYQDFYEDYYEDW